MQGEAATILLWPASTDPRLAPEAADLSLTELTARRRGEAGPWPEEPEQADTELGFLFRESGELVTLNQSLPISNFKSFVLEVL